MTLIDPLESPDHDYDHPTDEQELAAEYSPLNLQRRFRAIIGVGVAGLALMAWLFFNSSGTSDQVDDLIATNKAQQVLIDKLATQLDVARAQGAVVPAPEVIAAAVPEAEVSPPVQGERGDAGGVGTTGATGETGRGPTDIEIAAAVAAYCSNGHCVGAKGDKGDPGETVQGAPGANGADGASIQGAPGATGQNGQNGADGAPGAQGPGPTDEQIAAAVAAYCSVPGNCTVLP